MDYFTKKINETVYKPKKSLNPKKKWVSYSTFFIILVTVVVLMFILFQKYDNIKNIFSTNTWSLVEVIDSEYTIWQSVNFSWKMFSDWDLISYTHTINTLEWEVFGLKSRTIDLGSYNGDIEIYWKIEKILWDIFIIEVDNISGSVVSKIENIVSTWQYIPQAWIFFDKEFFVNYSIDSISNSNIVVRSLDSNQLIDISYFKCNTANPDQNCRILNDTFSKSADKDFTTSKSVSFYKLQSINSWYFANDILFGYFINDVPESELIKLSDYIILINRAYVNNYVISNIWNICTKWDIKLVNPSYEIKAESNNLLLSVKWTYNSWNVFCDLFLDPLVMWNVVLKDFRVQEAQETPVAQWTILNRDPNVKQFPINLEKPLEFNSSTRWYKIIFPSINISFAATNVENDFWQVWVNCFTQMNVVSHPNKENININPSIKIYECSIKNLFEESDKMILRTIDDRSFVIEIVDSAWIEFSNNIDIQLTS